MPLLSSTTLPLPPAHCCFRASGVDHFFHCNIGLFEAFKETRAKELAEANCYSGLLSLLCGGIFNDWCCKLFTMFAGKRYAQWRSGKFFWGECKLAEELNDSVTTLTTINGVPSVMGTERNLVTVGLVKNKSRLLTDQLVRTSWKRIKVNAQCSWPNRKQN